MFSVRHLSRCPVLYGGKLPNPRPRSARTLLLEGRKWATRKDSPNSGFVLPRLIICVPHASVSDHPWA